MVANRHRLIDKKEGIPPVGFLLVCKRLYRLIRPIWFETVDGPKRVEAGSQSRTLDYYSNLVLNGPARSIRTLSICSQRRLSESTSRYLFAMIISCTAVTSVRIDDLRHTSESGSPARDSQAPTLPLCALTALAFLPALRVLELTYDCALPPGTLPTPASLHELNLYGSSLGPAMSQYLKAVGVKRLRLRFVEAADLSSLPWASLECLRIDLSRLMSSEQVGRVTERLQQQVYFLSAAPQPSSGSTLFHFPAARVGSPEPLDGGRYLSSQ